MVPSPEQMEHLEAVGHVAATVRRLESIRDHRAYLAHQAGVPVVKLADEMGCSPTTTRARIHRGANTHHNTGGSNVYVH